MKTSLLSLTVLITVLVFPFASLAASIAIIESQSFIQGHNMDVIWREIAAGMGHNPVILPQSTLNDTNFFPTTDVLIVSSGVIDLPPNSVNTIELFLRSGKSVYIQSEYMNTYTTNQAFASIVNQNGGFFTWFETVTGTLQPIIVDGCLSQVYNQVISFNDFWYGCEGIGDNTIEKSLWYQNQCIGFLFCPPNDSLGHMITNTDQDWIRDRCCDPLMQNIISHLLLAGESENLSLTLSPIGAPIQIPPAGGSFSYDLTISNTGTVDALFDLWITAAAIAGTEEYNLYFALNLFMAAGVSHTRTAIVQNVPDRLPAGVYNIFAKAGAYPDAVEAEDDFTITKLADADNITDPSMSWAFPTTNFFEADNKISGRYSSSIARGNPQSCTPAIAVSTETDKSFLDTALIVNQLNLQISPNPFNSCTLLKFNLPVSSNISVQIYDVSGRLVETVAEGWQNAGTYEYQYTADHLASGIYFACLTAGSDQSTQKILYLK